MENLNGFGKTSWHVGPVNIGYTMLGFRYIVARKAININDILYAVGAQFGLTVQELKGTRRSAMIARPRQMAMLIAREALPALSLPQIAKRFLRDHTTIMHGIKAARKRLEWDESYFEAYLNVCETLGVHTVPRPAPSTTQPCMFCGEPFQSEGPHHRFCGSQSCKRSRAGLSSSLDIEPFGTHWS